jgi:hypothetical protein
MESYFATRRYNHTSKTVTALTQLNTSEAALFDSQTAVVESAIKKREALLRYQEQPERWGHELEVRRVQRSNEMREAQHHYEVNEYRRIKEVTHMQAELTHAKAVLTNARTVLVDAEQQLSAQRKHGELNYEIAHKKKNLELLDIELSEKERRALMRKQLEELDAGGNHRRRNEALADGDQDELDRQIREEVADLFGTPAGGRK